MTRPQGSLDESHAEAELESRRPRLRDPAAVPRGGRGAAASAGCPAAPTSPEPAVHAPLDRRSPTMSCMQVPGRSTLAPACPGLASRLLTRRYRPTDTTPLGRRFRCNTPVYS